MRAHHRLFGEPAGGQDRPRPCGPQARCLGHPPGGPRRRRLPHFHRRGCLRLEQRQRRLAASARRDQTRNHRQDLVRTAPARRARARAPGRPARSPRASRQLVRHPMFKLTWKFNGRTIPANRIADELGKAVRSKATDAAKQAMARVRCPVHGTGPRNLRVSGSGDRLRFQYDSCCDRLAGCTRRASARSGRGPPPAIRRGTHPAPRCGSCG